MSALGQVTGCPFSATSIAELKTSIASALYVEGWKLESHTGDRVVLSIYFRYLVLLLRVAGDPEVGLGEYAGCRLPRLPALYQQKKRWSRRIPSTTRNTTRTSIRRGLDVLSDEVLEFLHDQAERGQVIELTEAGA